MSGKEPGHDVPTRVERNAGSARGDRTRRLVRRLAVLPPVILIRSYQVLVRPLLIGCCKFCPTCSEYAVEALETHGVLRGTWLGLRRVSRCHPFGRGGLDPVPPASTPRQRRRPL